MTVSNALFRKLQDFEIEDLKAYARKTYVPGTDIKRDFEEHDCTKYPTKIKRTRESAAS